VSDEISMRKRRPLSPTDGWLAGLIFLLSLLLYIRTLVPTLLLGDGGEFQVLGKTLGLGHPTGYPIYFLLLKPFTWLPVRDIAYRINLSSAVFGSLTLALVYLCAAALLGRSASFSARLAAGAGSAALALTPLFWWHAVMAEVYTPATFFIALVLFLVILWRKSSRNGWLFWAGVVGGASIGVHGMAPLIAPAVAVAIALGVIRKPGWRRTLLAALAGGVLGLGLWLGAFWALDRHNPPSNNLLVSARYNLDVWQIDPDEFDANFWTRFKYLASGRMFHEVMAQDSPDQVRSQWERYVQEMQNDFPALFFGLAGVGLLYLLFFPGRRDRQGWRLLGAPAQWLEGVLLLLSGLGLLSFVLTYQIYDIWAFYIPTFTPLAILAGVGAGASVALATYLVGRLPILRRWARGVVGATFAAALVFSMIRPYATNLQKSWKAAKINFLTREEFRWYPYPVHDPNYPHRYAAQVINKVEDDAIIFTTWDMAYPLLYVAHIEQERTGILVFETYRTLWDINPSRMTLDFMRQSLATRPVYLTRKYDNLSGFRLVKVPGVELYRLERR